MTTPPQVKLLIVRHGQIRANVQGRWHGTTDSPLTARGRTQARRVGRELARTYGSANPPISALYSSPLQRCTNTALPIARQLGQAIHTVPNLHEYAMGEWEDLKFRDLASKHDFFNRSTADLNFAPPGGESLAGASRRIVSAFEAIAAAHPGDQRVVIVCHGAILAVAVATLVDGDPARWRDYHFDNTGVTEITLEPTAVVHRYNETHHL